MVFPSRFVSLPTFSRLCSSAIAMSSSSTRSVVRNLKVLSSPSALDMLPVLPELPMDPPPNPPTGLEALPPSTAPISMFSLMLPSLKESHNARR